jgi:formiminoglutamase
MVEALIDSSPFSRVTNGRFRGGFITRHHGRPGDGAHAIQMELAIRGYLAEPAGPLDETNWAPQYNLASASAIRDVLSQVLEACLAFARGDPARVLVPLSSGRTIP